jgi:hypothetical protein
LAIAAVREVQRVEHEAGLSSHRTRKLAGDCLRDLRRLAAAHGDTMQPKSGANGTALQRGQPVQALKSSPSAPGAAVASAHHLDQDPARAARAGRGLRS